MAIDKLWVAVGFAGQAVFSARFIVQWIVSERSRRTVVPEAFWWMSLIGGISLFAYFVWRQDPVAIDRWQRLACRKTKWFALQSI